MQWLIDTIKELVLSRFSGIIMMWHGLLVDIPDGWVLCDGNNGTPDLRTRFIFGAGKQNEMNNTGGDSEHAHFFTSNTHDHDIKLEMTADGVGEGIDLAGTENGPIQTELSVVTGTTDIEAHLPPYYLLAFIMKT